MKTTTSIERLEREIVTIKQNLLQLGPMHPGSVSQQFQVCGRKECRCMDPQKPERHGPYYKLAYVYRGKPVCRFVRAACVDDMKIRLAVYKQFRSLMDKWIKLSIQRGKLEFFAPALKAKVRKG
jgi:hypothetical protein